MTQTADFRGRTILVVEDESLVCALTEDILSDAGYDVEVAMRLDAGMQIAEQAALDVAILDINLGQGTTSYPIAKVLADRQIPFLFVSGYGASGLHPEWRHILVLQKPYMPEDLLEAVSSTTGEDQRKQ
jgi:DNA-binding response OmpR family regulator